MFNFAAVIIYRFDNVCVCVLLVFKQTNSILIYPNIRYTDLLSYSIRIIFDNFDHLSKH